MNSTNNTKEIKFVWKGVANTGYFELKIAGTSIEDARFKLFNKINSSSIRCDEIKLSISDMTELQKKTYCNQRKIVIDILNEAIIEITKDLRNFYDYTDKLGCYNILDNIIVGTTYGKGFITLREFIMKVEPQPTLL
jgi:hypothetical protein